MPRYGSESPSYVEFSNIASGRDSVDTSAPRQHFNPMYAEAQVAIYNGNPPTLPAPRNSSMGRPISPDHYERLPGDSVVKDTVASGKYNRLKPEAKAEQMLSGKYDSLSPATAGNLYVIDQGDGYKVLPGNPRPVDTMKSTKNELLDLPLPPTNFNVYDSS